MFRDLFTFVMGAAIALFSVDYTNKFEKERAWFARIWRVAEIEARTGLDVEWIEETQAWTGLQKECARTAAEVVIKTEEVRAKFKKTPVGYGKVAEKFEKNLELGMDPYDIRVETHLNDKKALEKMMEARNADRTSQQVAAALSKHFPGEPVATTMDNRMIRSTGSAGSEIERGQIFSVKIPRMNDSGSEFERRADLVATPDVDVAPPKLEANMNASNQNEQPVVSAETLAGSE